jgi:hypothetical protein
MPPAGCRLEETERWLRRAPLRARWAELHACTHRYTAPCKAVNRHSRSYRVGAHPSLTNLCEDLGIDYTCIRYQLSASH